MLEPLKMKNTLAGNSKSKLKHAVSAKLKNGEEILLADPKATRAMVALMDMQAVMGGAASHWGGPSAFAELMSAVHGYVYYIANNSKKEWFDLFHLVNDAGHCENGLYALKANYGQAGLNLNLLKGFRSIESGLTGHGEAHLFPEGIFISNGPLGSGLPQAQGLAIAEALSGKNRITVTAISDGGCMEGEARESLASIPGLAKNKKLGPFVMLISDNNTKLSGRIDKDAFSMSPTFNSLSTLGWKVIEVKKGNDMQACLKAFEEAVECAKQDPTTPVAIHAQTVKGFGVKSTEESSSGGHGFPLKKPQELKAFLEEIYSGQEVPQEFIDWSEELVLKSQSASKTSSTSTSTSTSTSVPSEKVQEGVAKALIKMRQKGYPIVSITSDLPGSTGVAAFRKEFPKEQIDVGVAESNMVSVGIGLSKEGYIPIVDTFSQFGVTKGALPLIMSALSQGPVIAIFSHAGFQDAADGASHQSLSYLAMTNSIPYTDSYVLSCSLEAEELVTQAIQDFVDKKKKGEVPRSKIFFLGRENFPRWVNKENETYTLNKAKVVFDNTDRFDHSVTLVAAGPLLFHALMASEELATENCGTIVVNPSVINHLDVETIAKAVDKTDGLLVTVEDHQLVGGMGAVVTHGLAQLGKLKVVKSLGVKDHFGQSAYLADELYEKHKIDKKAIVAATKEILKSKWM
ncbi:MAG: transketolase [Bdellovibrionaceae bacterium]|nr:transketolase [Pseudobdellovibrionaceae bacterium]